MAAGVNALVVVVMVTLCRPVHLLAACDAPADCSQESSQRFGESLLQVRSGQVSRAEASKAEELMPDDLYELGKQIFHNEEGLQQAIQESILLNTKYGGVPITLRIFGKDNAAERLGKDSTEDGQEYGFENLMEAHGDQKGLVNMVDMGGNYGAVTIAAYKKVPGTMRAAVIEPIAKTYFFMRWNLFLNDIPTMSPEDFVKDTSKPGVVPLYGGVSEKPEDVSMCAHPSWSMNAHFVANFEAGMGCDCSYMDCTKVPGITTDSLLDEYFKDSIIHLFKMDCEGCENHALPALAKRRERVKHLVGELHMPEEHLIDLACEYDGGKFVTKVCRLAKEEWASSLPLECNQERKKCAWWD